MRVFTVHAAPAGRPPGTCFLPEGFSTWALLLGPFWLLRHGAWPFAIIVVAALAVLPWVCSVGIALLTGLCGHDARRAMVSWRGWRLDGVVVGMDAEQAELRWLDLRPSVSPGA